MNKYSAFFKSMPNWLLPKLLERSDTDTKDQLCTFSSQQIAKNGDSEECFEDGFNEITELNSDKMLKQQLLSQIIKKNLSRNLSRK